MKLSLKTTLTTSVLFLLISQMNMASAAADAETYPGSMCKRWGGSNSPTYSFSGMGNNSTSQYMYVDCPIVKKDALNQGSIKYVTVRLKEDANNRVRCSVQSRSFDYSGYKWGGWGTANKYSNLYSGMVFSNVSVRNYQNLYLSCRLPKKNGNPAYIVSYTVQID